MRKILAVAAVNLALLVVLAIAAELAFGTWFSKEPLDQLGLVRNSTATVTAGPLYPGGGDVLYRRDAWGFRGAVADPARITILTVGGSTTNQLYLPEDKTWQAVMEREFQAGGRNDVVVANAGIDGQSTIGHVKAMTDWFPHVPGLKPRFILFYVGLNDVHLSGSSVDRLGHSSRHKWMRQHSALVRLWTQVSGTFAARRARLNHQAVDYAKVEWTDTPSQPDWRPDRDALIAYKERLSTLAQMAHAMGAVPIFITQPRGDFRVVGGKVQGVVIGEGLNGVDNYLRFTPYNQATREVCRDEGLMCLDLAREVTFDTGDFYDYVHNTPQGAEKIGRWLQAKLAGLV